MSISKGIKLLDPKEIIAQGYLKEAIVQLRDLIKDYKEKFPEENQLNEIFNDLTLQLGSFKSWEKELRSNQITRQEFYIQYARTAKAVIDQIDQLSLESVKELKVQLTEHKQIIEDKIDKIEEENDREKRRNRLFVLSSALLLGLLVIIGITHLKNVKQKRFFNRIVQEGEFKGYAEYYETYGDHGHYSSIVIDSLQNNINILITGEWETDESGERINYTFLREGNRIEKKIDGVLDTTETTWKIEKEVDEKSNEIIITFTIYGTINVIYPLTRIVDSLNSNVLLFRNGNKYYRQ